MSMGRKITHFTSTKGGHDDCGGAVLFVMILILIVIYFLLPDRRPCPHQALTTQPATQPTAEATP